MDPPGFSCPGVPLVPVISVFFNMVLFAQVCTALHVRSVLVSVTDFSSKKSLSDVALTYIYHHILMTDGIDTLLGSYMKKRGIDLSSLASSLWEFMLAMASTTLFLPAQTTLLLVTTESLLKLHELCQTSKFFENTVPQDGI